MAVDDFAAFSDEYYSIIGAYGKSAGHSDGVFLLRRGEEFLVGEYEWEKHEGPELEKHMPSEELLEELLLTNLCERYSGPEIYKFPHGRTYFGLSDIELKNIMDCALKRQAELYPEENEEDGGEIDDEPEYSG